VSLPTFDLRLVPSFMVLADELHFGRAADRLSMAQPALSRQIARLERQLGVTLLIRSSQGVSLTSAGDELVAAGREILIRAVRAQFAVGDDAGELTVHVGDGLNPRLFQAVTTFAAAHPQMRLSVLDGALSGTRAVADGTADAGFGMLQGVPVGLAYAPVDRRPLGVAYPAERWPGGLEGVSWNDLDGERLFVPPAGSGDQYGVLLRATFARFDARFTEVQAPLVKPSYLSEHVLAGQGLLVCPEYVTADWPETLAWHLLNPEVACELGIVWNDRSASDATRRFVQWCAAERRLIAPDGELSEKITDCAQAFRHATAGFEYTGSAAARLYAILGDALSGQNSALIERLTVVNTIFLPLTLATSFFGMNFRWLTDRIGSAASFGLLGISVPLALTTVSLLVLKYVSRPRRAEPRDG
jgi:DNA-binding transcriptional LysR family regulator